ncbi:hypothetical protein [Streptococcus equi]|uniref:Membrane protein n=1 Tax=Streptococcus equi subsp. zooepidemicus TaxID=40041 RepID=A0AAX2LIF5_STRSZ|nr:hypothetical protein [Streptococcus equi]QUQ80027.1 hypothetical protein LJFMMFNO_01033 [Streptococcus equi subsp. zooepidemicus]WKF67360.1 hypothetical protein QYM01_04855 [Streptococcus equi subsp. zooepidemicus]WOK58118.1 hypothetical protein RIM63_04900 [Streptococcus equi subsp. zooepidemicus]SQE95859.1 membrane protein [Streptococcus equi subsp. zooepidemicus]SUO82383.1 membrane protein [Streptococcus equi subsp. zooepidemicus]
MKKQQNKRRKLIGIVTLIAILGGVLTMNWLNDERLNRERREQERAVIYLSNTYENIHKIKIIGIDKNLKTGSMNIATIVNSKYYISVTFMGGEIYTGVEQASKDNEEFLNRRKKAENKTTLSKDIEVIYKEK